MRHAAASHRTRATPAPPHRRAWVRVGVRVGVGTWAEPRVSVRVQVRVIPLRAEWCSRPCTATPAARERAAGLPPSPCAPARLRDGRRGGPGERDGRDAARAGAGGPDALLRGAGDERRRHTRLVRAGTLQRPPHAPVPRFAVTDDERRAPRLAGAQRAPLRRLPVAVARSRGGASCCGSQKGCQGRQEEKVTKRGELTHTAYYTIYTPMRETGDAPGT